ncbi:hypothetical protein [Methylobacterium nonmethylotrophicum]|uniref:Uncharacterized protein n=1 Tax=Methylobacterium nonmethylotrophicum TaxID=1141884 RepID=A0A4Z0NFR3_9HYPH|nr:hypothetical protein [Methylobacterium nonmethylotrophicum]TGD94908.1 hypothetical protein EU555_30515 [Methylobacterium nonmethylotrophicum]
MKFCARLTGCKDAYTVGAPGTVKIAKDRAPIDDAKVNDILGFLRERLSPDDFATLQDLVDDLVDEVEEANPSAQMATDGLPQSSRRSIRRAVREAVAEHRRPAHLAQDRALPRRAGSVQDFNDRFGTARIRSGDNGRQLPKPKPAMDSAANAAFDERYGTARIRSGDGY